MPEASALDHSAKVSMLEPKAVMYQHLSPVLHVRHLGKMHPEHAELKAGGLAGTIIYICVWTRSVC